MWKKGNEALNRKVMEAMEGPWSVVERVEWSGLEWQERVVQ